MQIQILRPLFASASMICLKTFLVLDFIPYVSITYDSTAIRIFLIIISVVSGVTRQTSTSGLYEYAVVGRLKSPLTVSPKPALREEVQEQQATGLYEYIIQESSSYT